MKNITVREFRNNIKKYAELANSEQIIINRGGGKAFTIVPIDSLSDNIQYEELKAKLLEPLRSELKKPETQE